MKLKTFLIILLIFTPLAALHSKPLSGVAIISYDTSRASAISDLLEKHLINVLDKTGIFSSVKYGIIKKELNKFKCTSERCILGFSKNAKFSMILTGQVKDRKDYIIVQLKAFSSEIPYNNGIINSYKVKIDLKRSLSARDISLICEEHSGRFLAETLKKFRMPLFIKNNKINFHNKISGKYPLYTYRNDMPEKIDTIYIKNNTTLSKIDSTLNPFIFLTFEKESEKLNDYYLDEKKKIVFTKSSLYDTLYFALFTVPASVTMPFASPFLGYGPQSDWQGLGLWTLNVSPYLYAETMGFINRPSKLRSQKDDISKDDIAMNYFAWYMLLAGGTPLFIDAFSHDYLMEASNFRGKGELMGNKYTAAYLSLVSNGGGHFYRGNRQWGYFYFHLNNILLYMTLREYAEPQVYDEASRSYTKKSRNNKKLLLWSSALTLSKSIEIIHALVSDENIGNGEIITKPFSADPIFAIDYSGKPVYRLNFTYRY